MSAKKPTIFQFHSFTGTVSDVEIPKMRKPLGLLDRLPWQENCSGWRHPPMQY